jgi:Flp pilus assembly protein TadG
VSRARSRSRYRSRDERGQLTVLVVGFAIVVLLLLAVVTDVSKAFLVRRDLAQLADGAALAGTRGVASSVIEGSASGEERIELDEARASQEVSEYLESTGTDYSDLTWTVAVQSDEVTVRLEAVIGLPFTVPGTTGTVTVTADASSQLRRR